MKIASLNLGKTEKPESERFAPFMTFLKFVIPGFKEAYDQKMALQNYDAKMRAQYKIRVPLQETPKSIFDLPYKYTTKNTKPKKQLVSKKLFGGKNEYKFRRGSLNLNNGYGVTYDLIILTIQNGQPTYDTPPVVAGRTIYQTPNGNDTIFYRNNPDIFNHTPKGDPNQQRAKNYFYKMIKSAPSEGLEYKGTKYWNNLYQSTYDARRKALRGYQGGGELPTAQKAEDRYKGGRRVTNSSRYFGDSISIRGVESLAPWYKYPAQIVEYIRHSKVSPVFNDTTYAERPSFFRPLRSITRAAGNDYYFGKKQRLMLPIFGGFINNDYERSAPLEAAEYETLKRRFNTAWGITK